MKKLLYSLLFISCPLFAQTNPPPPEPYDFMSVLDRMVSLPQTPEVAAFQTFGATPANLYTGSPNISIPVYNLQGNEMSMPISLTYEASGIKVEQSATNVGLGWNLNFGGVVSRKTNHFPDNYINHNMPRVSSSIEDYYFGSGAPLTLTGEHPPNIASQLKTLYREYQQGTDEGYEVDTQADTFSFNVNGLSGTIIIDYSKTEPGTTNPFAYCYENPDIKISANLGGQSSFIITNVDGTTYEFSTPEVTWNEYSTDANEFIREHESAWYLTKVTSPNGLDTFEFTYSSPLWGIDLNQVSKKMVLMSTFDPFEVQSTYKQFPPINHYKTKQFHLSSITYTSDQNPNTAVELLSVSVGARTDAPNLKKYNQLVFKDMNGNIVQKTDFDNNTYFSKGGQNTKLKLDAIRFWRDDLSDPREYSFTYYDQIDVPDVHCNAIDFWGYYTDGSCSGDLIAEPPTAINWYASNNQDRNRTPNFGKTENGALEFITYPTGGKTKFVYQPHSNIANASDYNSVDDLVGGLRLRSSIDYTSGGIEAQTKFYFYNDINAKIQDGTYSLAGLTPGVLGTEYDTSGKAQQDITFWEEKTTSTPPGPTNGGLSTSYMQYSSNIAPQAPQAITYDVVSELIFKDNNLVGSTITSFYNEDYVTSGTYLSEPYINREVLNGEVKTIKQYANNTSALKLLSETINEYSQEIIPDTIYSQYNGIFLHDDRIQPTFANSCLAVVDVPFNPNVKNLARRDQDWYCLSIGGVLNCGWVCDPANAQDYGAFIEFKVNRYSFKPNWKHLDRTINKTYEQSGSVMIDTVSYQYNSTANHHFTTNIKSTDSKGILSETEIMYPSDVVGQGLYITAEESIFNDWIARNQISEPVLAKQNYSGSLLSTQKKHYSVLFTTTTGFDVVRPSSVEVAKSSDALEVRREYHSYDTYGNLTEVSNPDGTLTYYIWGYNGKQLLAQIQNKPPGNIPTGIQSLIDTAILDSNTEDTAVAEDSLRTQLNTIRDDSYFNSALMVSFTYDPGVGVTSVTDPRGYVMYYEYDQHNRLVSVKDADNNLMGENEYSYRINN